MALERLVDTAPLGDTLPAPAVGSIPRLSLVPGFSAVDLIYNRMGSLSPDQKAESSRRLFRDLMGAVLALAITGSAVAVGGWVAALFLLYAGWYALKVVRDFMEVRHGVVHQVDGDLVTRLVPDSEGPDRYYLYIELMKLEMTERAFRTLRNGGPYRIYYFRKAHRVVGGELLPGWRPLP